MQKNNTVSDYVSDLNDNHSPVNDIDTYSCDIPQKRWNVDNHPPDQQGKRFLQLCKNSSIRILNGRMPGDRRGNLTRFPLSMRESPSTLDYIASDFPMMDAIRTLTVMPHLGLSDHCSLCVYQY